MARFVVIVAGLALLALRAQPAWAYPQWQFSSGVTRCNVCHFAPAGGGLVNARGREANGDELSTFAGEGAFLYGVLTMPSWLALGAELRGAYVAQDVQDINGTKQAVFPMQTDLEVRAAMPLGFSAYATGGMRGQVRPNGDIVPLQNYQPISKSQLISREHWLMWKQQGGQGWYARAGRFFAPFGLRLAEHITYIRRDLGFDQLRESYNLSGGFVGDEWELHLTAFAPDLVRHIGGLQSGAAAYFERRVLETGAIAVQARYAVGQGAQTVTSGVVAKYYVAPLRTLFLAEADLVGMKPDDVSVRGQFVGAAGAAILPLRGVMVTVLGERKQEDIQVGKSGWNALTALLAWFPVPHAELQLMGRMQFAEAAGTAKTLFLQIHYFL